MPFWTSQRVLVTGGHGFFGSHVVERLKKLKPKALAIPRSADYDLTRADHAQTLLNNERPDIVLHLAAVCGGIGANQAEPGRFFHDNILMGVHMMEFSRLAGVKKFVQVGTVCAYPKFAPVPFKEEALWDGYPEETNAPYGIAKKALLVQAQAYREQYGFNAIYLLPINMYGPRDHFDLEKSHVVPALIRKCLEAVEEGRDVVECWGTGKPTREFLYVEDAARGLLLAAERYEKPEPVNLGSGEEISIKDLAERIAKLTGFRGRIRWNHARPDGQPRRRLDVSRAKKEFGFEAKVGLDEGLKKTIAWYRAQERTASHA